jgi:hypothetical protein
MGRKSRNKSERRVQKGAPHDPFWEDAVGIHTSFLVPGEPSPGLAKRMSEEFQKGIRNSLMWKQMVDRFGEEEAERLLKKCKAEIK